MRIVTAVMLVLLLFACERERREPGSSDNSGDTGAPAGARAPAPARAPIAPAEALGVLRAVGDAQSGTARVAQQVSVNSVVVGYARVVIADHAGIAQLIDSILARTGESARDNVTSTTLRLQGDSVARALSALTSGFNNTFIEEQVRTQQQALQLIDTLLIPSVRDTAVQNLLRALRPTVAAHLQRAMQILAERRRVAAAQGEEWISGFTPRPEPIVPTPAPAPAQAAPPPTPPDTLS
jgi:predicted outer membrane protein